MRTTTYGLLGAALLLAVVAGLSAWTTLGERPGTPPSGDDLEALADYGEVPPFALLERSGRRVTRDDLRGLVWIANFIYTECTESCPTQTLALAALDRELPADASLRLLSITVDPAHDTLPVLRRYAEQHRASARWWFLTGPEREIHCFAREGLRLAVADPARGPVECGRSAWWGTAPAWASHGTDGVTILHSARVVLVDDRARIRAYHLATEPASMRRLRANAGRLLPELPGRPR